MSKVRCLVCGKTYVRTSIYNHLRKVHLMYLDSKNPTRTRVPKEADRGFQESIQGMFLDTYKTLPITDYKEYYEVLDRPQSSIFDRGNFTYSRNVQSIEPLKLKP